jgi:hypothetical protein
MQRHGLWLNHVEFFPDLHGGTLRWHIGKTRNRSEQAIRYLTTEQDIGLDQIGYYAEFADRVDTVRKSLLTILSDLRETGASIAGYGAAAKGSTLLNATGIGTDLVEYVVDRNVHKHGTFMPGTHQPVMGTETLLERQPDYVLLLAWNFADEIMTQQSEYLARGGRFIVPVPVPEVIGG